MLIKVEACGVCHGDAAAKYGACPGTVYPRVPGSRSGRDRGQTRAGGGRVAAGRAGGRGLERRLVRGLRGVQRGPSSRMQDSWVTGLSVDGGYAEYMVARTSALVRHPGRAVVLGGCGPLLCAGATTFSALQESGATARRRGRRPRHRRAGPSRASNTRTGWASPPWRCPGDGRRRLWRTDSARIITSTRNRSDAAARACGSWAARKSCSARRPMPGRSRASSAA